ncbi:iron-containing alcohol dehydrogenase [Parafrankia sp. EUN1f]|nr:iron-containing alcohol dehydrogenase [Parafrankia sp. EUN1f]
MLRSSVRLHHGPGSAARLADELSRLGSRRPALLAPRSVAHDPGLRALLGGAAGRPYAIVESSLAQHSPIESVLAAAERLRAAGADAIVVAGGGSAIVTARATAIVLADGPEFRRPGTAPRLPIVVLPTTPTTASVKAGTAVTERGLMRRRAMLDPATRATALIVDPRLLASTPPALVRDAGLTTLVMAVEGLTTRRRDAEAEQALGRAVLELPDLLRRAATEPADLGVRTRLVLAAAAVGDATDATGGALTAAIAHTVGHVTGGHNGPVDAVVLPHALRLCAQRDPASLDRLAAVLGCAPVAVPLACTRLLEGIVPVNGLAELGVSREDVPALAATALMDPAARGTTFQPVVEELEDVLLAALAGPVDAHR